MMGGNDMNSEIYNVENGFPLAVSDILDKLDMGIECSRADEEKDASEKGYYAKIFDYLPKTGVEWYNYFLLENGTLKELIDSVNKYIEDYSLDGEVDWISTKCEIINAKKELIDSINKYIKDCDFDGKVDWVPDKCETISAENTLEELKDDSKYDAKYMLNTLKSFVESIEIAYPDLSDDILINDNLITDKKIENYMTEHSASEADIVIMYMQQASLQDKLDFIGLSAKAVHGNIDRYVEETLAQMPDDILHDYAVKYCADLMSKTPTNNKKAKSVNEYSKD